MSEQNEYAIVVTLLEGRGFPSRAHHSLIVEGKFDGEVLTSDPVRHESAISIQNELAWVVQKKNPAAPPDAAHANQIADFCDRS